VNAPDSGALSPFSTRHPGEQRQAHLFFFSSSSPPTTGDKRVYYKPFPPEQPGKSPFFLPHVERFEEGTVFTRSLFFPFFPPEGPSRAILRFFYFSHQRGQRLRRLFFFPPRETSDGSKRLETRRTAPSIFFSFFFGVVRLEEN